MKIFLTFFVLLFSSSVVADDVSDFQIEGFSIGDSLLDYMTEEEIKTEIDKNKVMYEYLEEGKFGEVYFLKGLETYDQVSFMVKPYDEKFMIYEIRGILNYKTDINGCHKKQNEIVEEFSTKFKNTTKTEDFKKHPIDPTGRSTVKQIAFFFELKPPVSRSTTTGKNFLNLSFNI